MRRIFVHPDVGGVNSGGNPYLPKDKNPQAQKGGGNSDFTNSIMTLGSSIGDNISKIGGEKGSIFGGVANTFIDIVGIVLGQGAEPVNVADGKQVSGSNTVAQQISNMVTQYAQQGLSQSQGLSDGLNTTVTDGEQQIDENGNLIIQTTEDMKKTGEDFEESAKDTQATIDKNNAEIEQKQARQQELIGIINDLRSKNNLQAPSKSHSSSPRPPMVPNDRQQTPGMNTPWASYGVQGGDNNSDGFVLMELSGNMELDAAINEYNQLGIEIQTLSLENTALAEGFTSEQEIANDEFEVSEELINDTATEINVLTESILANCTDVKGAIEGISKMLQDTLPGLNKVSAIEIAGMMTKQALCATESGTLAAAAAAMSASSFFSFGATSSQAAELSTASVNKGVMSGKAFAQAVIERALQQAQTALQEKTTSDISSLGTGVTGMKTAFNAFAQQVTSTISPDLLSGGFNNGLNTNNNNDNNKKKDIT